MASQVGCIKGSFLFHYLNTNSFLHCAIQCHLSTIILLTLQWLHDNIHLNITLYTKALHLNQESWVGCRKMTNAYKNLVWKPDGKRPRHRGDNNIKNGSRRDKGFQCGLDSCGLGQAPEGGS